MAACAEPDATEDPSTIGAAPSPVAGVYVTLTRPPNVPADFVATPNGWFDPDCVHEVAEHEKVLADTRIARGDGSIRREAATCRSPRYDVQGNAVREDANARSTNPTTNGWIEWADSTALGPLSYVHASWNVPASPTSNTGQVVYFFPGLENATNVQSILQPVLGWNQSGGPSGWSLASWNCCQAGMTWHGPYLPVSAGTTVTGDMTGSNCNATTGVCTSWTIVSSDSTGAGVSLTTTVNQPLNWLFGHALEAYNIDSCSEMPTGSSSTASSFSFRRADGTVAPTPAWRHNVSAVTPSCVYSVSHTSTTARLSWDSTPPVCTPGASRTCCPFAAGCGCRGTQSCESDGQWGVCEDATPRGTLCQ